MKKLLIFFISLFSLADVNAIPEVKVYSNGDYGLDFDGCQLNKRSDAMTIVEEAKVDEEGNLYFLLPRNTYGVTLSDGTVIPKESDAIIKFDHTGRVAWAKVYDAGAEQFEIFDGYLYLPTYNCFWNNYVMYDENKYYVANQKSYFILKIDIESGDVVNYVEIEKDNFLEDGFFSFDVCNGYAISPEGDLWFMFDINEEYSRVNKDYPVSFDRHGDADKCLFVLSKDLDIKRVYCLGSNKSDETEFEDSEHIASYMTFAGDTLYMYVPFGGKECNISLDPENPVIVKNKTLSGRPCAAFCKYLVKGDKVDLLAYNVISGNDGQIKRFAVNSQNKVIATQPERIWDAGDNNYYEILQDMTLHKLDGYAYLPMRTLTNAHTFLYDQNDDIVRIGLSCDENVFSESIVLPKPERNVGIRVAKYDGQTLQNKWVLALDSTDYDLDCRVDAKHGLLYLISLNVADYDPSGSTYITSDGYDGVIARYIETYRVKTSSENASIVVNEGNDMVRHGSDAEIVVSAAKGYHVESVTTSKGDKVEVSKNGHCTIKNVTEPVELVIATALGENAVTQYNAAVSDVYPNPVKDLLNVDDAEDASFEIFDLSGNIVYSGVVSDGKIVTSELSEGMYVLTIKKEIGAYSTKIVKK